MRRALHLFHSVYRRQAYDRRSMLNHSVDGPLYRRRVDQRPDSVMHQDDIVLFTAKGAKRPGHRLLAVLPTLNHVDAAGESEALTVFSYLRLNPLDLRGPHRDKDSADAWRGGKGAQRMNQDRQAVQLQKLLGLRGPHSSADAGGWKNRKYLHNQSNIHRRLSSICAPGATHSTRRRAVSAKLPREKMDR